MNIICKLFGHTFDETKIMIRGKWRVYDETGRIHQNIKGVCPRCDDLVQVGHILDFRSSDGK